MKQKYDIDLETQRNMRPPKTKNALYALENRIDQKLDGRDPLYIGFKYPDMEKLLTDYGLEVAYYNLFHDEEKHEDKYNFPQFTRSLAMTNYLRSRQTFLSQHPVGQAIAKSIQYKPETTQGPPKV